MFYLNVGYQWSLVSSIEDLKSGLFLASGNSSERLARTQFPDFTRVLLDPQLYLAGLDSEACSKVCARLASFPWFGVKNLPEFDSGEMKRREWDAKMKAAVRTNWPGRPPSGEHVSYACRAAIEYQESAGCSHILLPSPLIDEREGEADTLATWLDASLDIVEETEVALPVLATVAIDESTLNEDAFEDAGFLDSVVDQVTPNYSPNSEQEKRTIA